MKESELDIKLWSRRALAEESTYYSTLQADLQQRQARLHRKIEQLDADTEELVSTIKHQLTDLEFTALNRAMQQLGTRDQVHFAIATQIHLLCKLQTEQEQIIKLPKRHLILNTSVHFFHFYFFPYKQRLERELITNLDSWFVWLISMLINDFKI